MSTSYSRGIYTLKIFKFGKNIFFHNENNYWLWLNNITLNAAWSIAMQKLHEKMITPKSISKYFDYLVKNINTQCYQGAHRFNKAIEIRFVHAVEYFSRRYWLHSSFSLWPYFRRTLGDFFSYSKKLLSQQKLHAILKCYFVFTVDDMLCYDFITSSLKVTLYHSQMDIAENHK